MTFSESYVGPDGRGGDFRLPQGRVHVPCINLGLVVIRKSNATVQQECGFYGRVLATHVITPLLKRFEEMG